MTQNEIIKMARESGFITGTKDYADGNGSVKYAVPVGTSGCLVELEKFAQLVAAKEREVCANQVQSWNTSLTDNIAAEIRAREEQA